jgi:hypothetical protein
MIQLCQQGPKKGTTAAPTYTYPIFDTFWNNEGLRATLFTKTIKSEALADEFPLLVNNFNSLLYSFINVK